MQSKYSEDAPGSPRSRPSGCLAPTPSGRRQATIEDVALHLKQLDPYIGDLQLDKVHLGTLQRFIRDRQKQGVRNRTVNTALSIVRRILNLSARLWRDENGLTWLETAPLIQLLPTPDS